MPPLTVNAHVVDASAAPATGGDAEPLREQPTVGPRTDFPPLEQTIVELDPGASARRQTGPGEEVLFVLDGTGSLELDGANHELEPESGAYLAPGENYRLSNTGAQRLTLIPVVDEGRLVGIITFQNLMHSMRLLAESRRLKR